jgi:hypothetical protein
MGLFSKKDKPIEPKGKPLDFDPMNVQIRDLRPGFFVDYNFKTFEITGGFEYSMKDYSFKTMKLDSGNEVVWLLIENGTDTYLFENVPVETLDANLQNIMSNFGKAPSQIVFKEATYTFENQSDGKYRDLLKNAMDWSRSSCCKYKSADGSMRLYAAQKGQSTFEGIVAKTVNAGEFSNFLPKV